MLGLGLGFGLGLGLGGGLCLGLGLGFEVRVTHEQLDLMQRVALDAAGVLAQLVEHVGGDLGQS